MLKYYQKCENNKILTYILNPMSNLMSDTAIFNWAVKKNSDFHWGFKSTMKISFFKTLLCFIPRVFNILTNCILNTFILYWIFLNKFTYLLTYKYWEILSWFLPCPAPALAACMLQVALPDLHHDKSNC